MTSGAISTDGALTFSFPFDDRTTMTQTRVSLHSRFRIGQVDPRIFGGFLEHMGRAVYQGVYDPDSIHADKDGLRMDVLDALGGLSMTAMRYPGGNFASGYHWQDGVGPADQRPTVRELAWQSVEPNRFGTNEYLALCRRLDWTPMITVNLGTGTPEEARNWVEYCNCPTGTRFADQRAEHGHPDPHGVGLWCLGNEMDGPWQIGHVPAQDYAVRAQQAAKLMKDTDKSVELVVCGSCGTGLSSYMEWDRTVLEYIGEFADYVSLHRYVGNRDGTTPDYLALSASIDKQIEEMDAVCRYVQARRRSNKRLYLCFDEWNVWYKSMHMNGEGKFAPHLIEEVYNLEDALVVAGFFHSFLRHADVLRIANLAQIVNVIAPILTDGDRMLRQSIYYPFQMVSKRRDGESLRVDVDGPGYAVESLGEVTDIEATAILGGKQLHVFLTNRSLEREQDVTVDLADAAIAAVESAEIVTGKDPKAANSYEKPDEIVSQPFDGASVQNGRLACKLPPLSFTAMTASLE
jgi:alpha-N-arabinofuranosidase